MGLAKAVTVVGAGLAGSECALQLALRGIDVVLYEQRGPAGLNASCAAAHKTNLCAELVCSNSFKSTKTTTAAGLLKEELSQLNSCLLAIAQDNTVGAGNALAVDRIAFARAVTEAIAKNPHIKFVQDVQVTDIPDEPCVIAAGPLCSDALVEAICTCIVQEQMSSHAQQRESHENAAAQQREAHENAAVHEQRATLSFYDAAAPIVDAATIDYKHCFMQSRYEEEGSGDYLNCPLTKDEYEALVQALVSAEKVLSHDFDQTNLFQACQPVEEVARSGLDSLRFGALKPKGLCDPQTGKEPYACVQLRAENSHKSAYNLVGFQTNLSWSEQRRVFSLIPALKHATYYRYGVMHRNTFLDSPHVLDRRFALPHTNLFFAGQITGTEGYTEAIASGLYAALNVWSSCASNSTQKNVGEIAAFSCTQGEEMSASVVQAEPLAALAAYAAQDGQPAVVFPTTTAIGSLFAYATDPHVQNYQPMHVNFGLVPPLAKRFPKKKRYEQYCARAQHDMQTYLKENPWILPSH